jgi:hypothetical protein
MIDGLYKTMGLPPHMQFHQSMESGQGKKLYFKMSKLSNPQKQTMKENVQYCIKIKTTGTTCQMIVLAYITVANYGHDS